MFGKTRIFQKAATGVLLTFMGLMLLVTIVAYSRTSGTTHQDMSQAHFIRERGVQNPPSEPIAENPKKPVP